MRAREADQHGYIERDGVRVYYEVHGTGEPTILFCPTWTLVDSRVWKMQVPYFARHGRVIVFDPRGNGRSDRPETVEAYAEREFAPGRDRHPRRHRHRAGDRRRGLKGRPAGAADRR